MLYGASEVYCYIFTIWCWAADEEPLDEETMKEWKKVRKWIVDGVFSDCHKAEEVNPDDRHEKKENETEYQRLNGGNVEEIELNRIPEEGDIDDVDHMDRKEALTIEDFRFCISRAPDFRSTFSFNI